MRGVEQADYWRLVEQLMLLGWYRAGHDADEQATQPSWGFREGHVTDAQRAATVSIEAPSEAAVGCGPRRAGQVERRGELCLTIGERHAALGDLSLRRGRAG